jgi:ADP-heptose:LPS heptosyltransferase
MRSVKQTETIIYFKHGLGNLIMLTPAIQALASMDKSKKVDICLSSHWKDPRRPAFDEFFDRWDIVQDVVNYPDQKFTKDYKLWFYTGHSEHSEALDVFIKKCPIKPTAPEWRGNSLHEVFWYLDIVKKLGYKGKVFDQIVPLSEKPIIRKKNGGSFYIGICNGTYSERMKNAKQWPYFDLLVETLKNYYGCHIIKIGYQYELKDIKADMDFVDKLSFCETAKVISQLDLLITTDTANMHTGDALNIPMIAIFGGTLISKNGALSKKAINLSLGLPCQPCQRTPSFYNCLHYNCINQLTVGDVMLEVRKIL